jgi:hypothetical protein
MLAVGRFRQPLDKPGRPTVTALVAQIDPPKLLACPPHAASRRHAQPKYYKIYLKLRVMGYP